MASSAYHFLNVSLRQKLSTALQNDTSKILTEANLFKEASGLITFFS
jgi:hypothetical protein